MCVLILQYVRTLTVCKDILFYFKNFSKKNKTSWNANQNNYAAPILKTPCGENQAFNIFSFLSAVFNMLKDKPCENSSVNMIAEHFLLKTAVYQNTV